MDSLSSKPIRFLTFANDKEDAEKKAKLEEAALRIEQAIAREKSLGELIDYKPPENDDTNDLANDTRPLYERLLEQKNRKQEAMEESKKLSNLVTKLDEDDANYLNEVAKSRREEELRKRLEVYDAVEQKKRLDEERNLDAEKKLKESLVSLNDKPCNKSSSSIRSKLSSMIKVKPRIKESTGEITGSLVPADLEECSSDKGEQLTDSDRQTRSSTRSSSSATKNEGKSKSNPAPEEAGQSRKRQKVDTTRKDEDEEDERDQDPLETHAICCCRSNQVMKCIGILPSLPIVEKFYDSSDDSEKSDDELGSRIVPRVCREK